MMEVTAFVGLDTDKTGIDVAVAEGVIGGEVRWHGRIANTSQAVAKVLSKIQKPGVRLEVCYEAGPCGYGLYRRLNAQPGVSCQVVAPSMVPRRPGDRVKTNRRDAVKLAKLHRAGELTAVWVPGPDHEAVRDLVRARGQAMADLTRHRQRITSFLMRCEVGYAGKAWTKTHRAFLAGLKFAHPAQSLMWSELLSALDQGAARRTRLDQLIGEQVDGWSLAWLVRALQALRGFGRLNAAILAAEIVDPRRFQSPVQLMGYLGLGVSEDSTGEKRRQGRLTKTGNGRARKVMIEAAWTYARQARPVGQSGDHAPAVIAVADKARHRLSQRYRKLRARGKRAPLAVAAVARELCGFVWAVAKAAQPDKA
jgi:transposase